MQPSNWLSRREILVSAVAGATGALAGCAGTEDELPPSRAASMMRTRKALETLTVPAETKTNVSPPSLRTLKSTQSTTLRFENGGTAPPESEVYECIVWEETGSLVIEDGATLGITETV
ncbi:hypothetical protein NDI56_03005 [Haloarcula sp. S1CR25-12]|uniref:Uncharacterized protein n=1 Tax=Haloarcula saliterrae TaxID=2950534 RepID=A0ABU2F7X9_9EURY|nr:hypothetical protein [Haloarcula sp. S1CR25-12]MDS0258377.1 hypothetical protein [Haloarcula sp. S1CR25-12]